MEREGIDHHDLVVCGGSALLALNFSRRTTRDVDIIARLDADRNLVEPRPLSPSLLAIAARVGRLLDLPPNWLNAEPVDQGPGKHLQDLMALTPTKDELLAAARWVLTQDAGLDFPAIVRSLLTDLGHDDIAGKL